MSQDHYAKLRNMYIAAPCNKYFAPDITVYKGASTVTIPIRQHMFHAGGALHRAVYFKALDDAALFAVSSLIEEFLVQTVSFHVHFTKPVTSGVLTAEGKVKSNGDIYVAESVVTDSSGTSVGRGSGTFMTSKIRLIPEIGYKL